MVVVDHFARLLDSQPELTHLDIASSVGHRRELRSHFGAFGGSSGRIVSIDPSVGPRDPLFLALLFQPRLHPVLLRRSLNALHVGSGRASLVFPPLFLHFPRRFPHFRALRALSYALQAMAGVGAAHQLASAVVFRHAGSEPPADDLQQEQHADRRRGKLRGLNVIGMKRSGIEPEVIKAAQRAFMFIFKGKEGNFETRLKEAKEKYKDNEMVLEQIKFIEEALSGRRNVMVAD